jgi:CheY-like chemotaxis protein
MTQLRPILLVDDNLNDIELALNALRNNSFANEVVVARDGEEALDFLHRRGPFSDRPAASPIVMLLDLKMPKKDGLEVLREMKADEALKKIPVVMLTSSREESDLVASYALGVNAYVVKPVGFPEFVKAIREIGIFWALINEPPPDGEAIAGT